MPVRDDLLAQLLGKPDTTRPLTDAERANVSQQAMYGSWDRLTPEQRRTRLNLIQQMQSARQQGAQGQALETKAIVGQSAVAGSARGLTLGLVRPTVQNEDKLVSGAFELASSLPVAAAGGAAAGALGAGAAKSAGALAPNAVRIAEEAATAAPTLARAGARLGKAAPIIGQIAAKAPLTGFNATAAVKTLPVAGRIAAGAVRAGAEGAALGVPYGLGNTKEETGTYFNDRTLGNVGKSAAEFAIGGLALGAFLHGGIEGLDAYRAARAARETGIADPITREIVATMKETADAYRAQADQHAKNSPVYHEMLKKALDTEHNIDLVLHRSSANARLPKDADLDARMADLTRAYEQKIGLLPEEAPAPAVETLPADVPALAPSAPEPSLPPPETAIPGLTDPLAEPVAPAQGGTVDLFAQPETATPAMNDTLPAPPAAPGDASALPDGGTDLATPTAAPAARIAYGRAAQAKTVAGTKFPVRYAVVEGDDLVLSHDLDMTRGNPEHPGWQQRNRTNAASRQQVDKITRTLDPSEVTEGYVVNAGAPVIAERNGQAVMVNGNGRSIAILRNYREGTPLADAYRTHIRDMAESFGLDPATVEGMEKPVLVRVGEFADDAAAAKVAREGDMDANLARDPVQLAREDAQNIIADPAVLGKYVPNETADLNSAANADFRRAFLARIPETEHGDLLLPDGTLSQDGLTRLRAALFQHVYGSQALTEAQFAEIGADAAQLRNALLQSAPRLLALRGTPYDIAPEIARAAETFLAIKRSGAKIIDALDQTALFGENTTVDPLTRRLVQFFEDAKRSSRRVTDMLKAYTTATERQLEPAGQTSMFGEDVPAVRSKTEILEGALDAANTRAASEDLFASTAGAGAGTEATPPTEPPAQGKAVGADVALTPEQRFQQNHEQHGEGVPEPSWLQKRMEEAADLWKQVTRLNRYLPRGTGEAKFAEANRGVRLATVNRTPQHIAEGKARQFIKDVTDGMTKEQLALFQKAVDLYDISDTLQGWKAMQAAGQESELRLRYGFDEPSLVRAQEAVQAEMNRPENAIVTERVQQRLAKWHDLQAELIDAYQNAAGTDMSDIMLSRPNYLRNQVLDYLGQNGRASQYIGRSGEFTGEINPNYAQTEQEVLQHLYTNIELAKIFARLRGVYDKLPEVMRLAAESGVSDWRGLAKDTPGHMLWKPKPGSLFYFNYGNPLEIDQLEMVNAALKEAFPDLAPLTGNPEFLLPDELAKTLDSLQRRGPEMNWVNKTMDMLSRQFKVRTLFWPDRIIKYMAANQLTDLETTWISNPEAFAKVGQVRDDFQRFFRTGEMSPEMASWVQEGGIHSTHAMQEIGSGENALDYLYAATTAKGNKLKFAKDWYFQHAYQLNTVREAVLRYATYLDQLEYLNAHNGVPRAWLNSVPDDVAGLRTNEAKAYKLSNDLIGAFDEVSEFGRAARRSLLPFYSWLEVNMSRTARGSVNLWLEAIPEEQAASIGQQIMPRVARLGRAAAAKMGKAALRLGIAYGALTLWNMNPLMRQYEAQLPEDVRRRPHITLGKWPDGRVHYVTNFSGMSDFLNFFGVDTLPSDLEDIRRGTKTVGEEVKQIATAPLRRLYGLASLAKGGTEIASGRAIDQSGERRDIHDVPTGISNLVGLRDTVDAVRGLPSRSPLTQALSALSPSADPEEAAYYDVLTAKRKMLADDRGTEARRGSGRTPDTKEEQDRADALMYYKRAQARGDTKLAEKFLDRYGELGGTAEMMNAALRRAHPTSGVSWAQYDALLRFLGPNAEKKLELAERYYDRLTQ